MVAAVIMALSWAPFSPFFSRPLKRSYRETRSSWIPFQPISRARSYPGMRWPLVAPAFP